MNNITKDDIKAFRFAARRIEGDNALDLYQNIATKSAVYPGQGTPLGLAYVALKLNGEAGELAEHVGKAMRDDGLMPTVFADVSVNKTREVVSLDGSLTSERRSLIIKEIGDICWYLSAACNELGITLSEAAIINLEKLADRQERNVLRGSGDER